MDRLKIVISLAQDVTTIRRGIDNEDERQASSKDSVVRPFRIQRCVLPH